MRIRFLLLFYFLLQFVFFSSTAQIKTIHLINDEIGGGKKVLYDIIEENGLKKYFFAFIFRNEEYQSITDTKIISCYNKDCLQSFIRDLKEVNLASNERSNLSWRRDAYGYIIDKYDFTNNIYVRKIDGTTNYAKLTKEELERLILKLGDIEFGSDKLKSGVVYNPNELSKTEIYKLGVEEFKKNNFNTSDSLFTLYKQKYPIEVYGHYWCFRAKAAIDSTMEKGLAIEDCKNFIKYAESDIVRNKSTIITAYAYLAAYTSKVENDLNTSLLYLNKILEIDPYNSDAQKNSDILLKAINNKRKK